MAGQSNYQAVGGTADQTESKQSQHILRPELGWDIPSQDWICMSSLVRPVSGTVRTQIFNIENVWPGVEDLGAWEWLPE